MRRRAPLSDEQYQRAINTEDNRRRRRRRILAAPPVRNIPRNPPAAAAVRPRAVRFLAPLPRNFARVDIPVNLPEPVQYDIDYSNNYTAAKKDQLHIDVFFPPVQIQNGFGRIVDIPQKIVNTGNPNNYFILPYPVVQFLSEPRDFGRYRQIRIIEGDIIRWDYLHVLFDDLQHDNLPYEPWLSREDRRNIERFFTNEARKMLSFDFIDDILCRFYQPIHMSSDPRFPTELSGPRLSIPFADVYELPFDLALYILYCISEISYRSGGRTYAVEFSWSNDPNNHDVQFLKAQGNNANITINSRRCTLSDVNKIYTALISYIGERYANLLSEDQYQDNFLTWNGSEGSGTRIRLIGVYFMRMYLTLVFNATHSQRVPGRWTPEIQGFIDATINASPTLTKRSVLVIKNPNDDKCLLYAIILGLFVEVLGRRTLFGSTSVITDATIFSKATIWIDSLPESEKNDTTDLIRKLGSLLIPVDLIRNEQDKRLFEYVKNLDKKVSMMLSVDDFRSQMREVESVLIPTNVCGIDVYGIDENVNKHVYPLYISKNREKTMQLLCFTPANSDTSHYCLISNMSNLLRFSGGKQFFSCSKCGACFYSRKMLLKHQEKCLAGKAEDALGYHWSVAQDEKEHLNIPEAGFCPKCRLKFASEFLYRYHMEHCFMEGKTGYRHVRLIEPIGSDKVVLKGSELDMRNEEKHLKTSRVMYADFECSIDPESGAHSFMSYGIYDWKSEQYECGYNLDGFWDFILKLAYEGKEDKVFVYFHNAMNYDANFILRYVLQKIKEGNPKFKEWGIKTIMKSTNKLQKLVFYTNGDDGNKRTIHIGDTFLFLTLSLERIVGSIRKDDIEENLRSFPRFFKVFQRLYPGVRLEEIDHILRKNIFPYRFFTDSTRLQTPIMQFLQIFEPIESNRQFFSERVTLEDLANTYNDTKHVIETFRCKSARDYHDLYLCCDVMQLADVFDRSMNILWETHHIHLTRYLGMPSAAWAAFLRHDPTMEIPLYQSTFYAEFFKGMIRGGVTSAAIREAEADETHSIIYLDVNGLYPYVMQAYGFPCGEFTTQFMNWNGADQCHDNLKKFFEVFEKEKRGACFCVDMHITDEVKKMTDDYPFAPEHRKIFSEYFEDEEHETLTPYLQQWSDANEGEKMFEFTGLVCTLYDKEKYNVHWRLLKFYIEHGVEITKVHFGVFFNEGEYLAGYVRTNIEIRNGRKDELGKTVYKLLGNSVYGKTFESPFKRNTFDIVTNETRLQGLIDESAISSMTPIDDLGWIVRRDGEEILLDKPTYIGACVCEFAKLHMYTLLYDKMKRIFPGYGGDPGCRMVYTDTDSFILLVSHPPELAEPKKLFGYIKSVDPTLIGGIGGQVKSETSEEDTIKKVIALRSKVYAYVTKKGKLGKRAKGTTCDAQELRLDWEKYESVLNDLKSYNTRNTQFQRKTFTITTTDVERRSLSVNDGKRYICRDGIHTHAFGYLPPNTFE